MSRHVEVECWVDKVHFDSCAEAAEALGICPSVLSRGHKKSTHFHVLDDKNQMRTIDFLDPGAPDPAPPPPPLHEHHRGEPLLRMPVRHRLGAYR